MKEYKVYAKILGYVLPSQPLGIAECKIEKMSYREQRRRGFKPLKGWTLKRQKGNYLTFPMGADFRIMKSNFIVSTILKCNSPNEAIGLAEAKFDKLIGSLMLYMYYWWTKEHPRTKIRFSNYDYQICKIYSIVNNREIEVKDLRPVSTSATMCHYPAFKNLSGDFKSLLLNFMHCRNEIFQKSFEYFINGTTGFNSQLAEEKIFLDLFKSIELIILSFRRKKTKGFKVKLIYASKRLNLSDADQKKIIKFYEIRNKGDFAHARKSRSWLPPQYPKPGSNAALSYGSFYLDNLRDMAQKIIIKYFEYIHGRHKIIIRSPEHNDEDNILISVLGSVNAISPWHFEWGTDYLEFRTRERNKYKLIWVLKKKLAEHFNVPIQQIKIMESKDNQVFIKVLTNL